MKTKVNRKYLLCTHVSEECLVPENMQSDWKPHTCSFCTLDVPQKLGFDGVRGRIWNDTEFKECIQFTRS